MSRLFFKVIALALMVKVSFATLVSFSPDVHEWLHIGEQLCWHEEHCDEASRHSNHHGEPEQHQHGLLTLFAEGQLGELETTTTELEEAATQALRERDFLERLVVTEFFAATASRAPPTVA